jgi:hypothetical protein
MKKNILLALCLSLACILAFGHGNQPGKAELAVPGGTVTIEYGSPDLNGRDVSTLLQPGKVWRLGADRPTNLDTPVALKFGDATIQPGKYVLRARLDEQSQWWLEIAQGTTAAGKTQLKKSQAPNSEAHLKITMEGKPQAAVLKIHWGTQLLETNFAVAQ